MMTLDGSNAAAGRSAAGLGKILKIFLYYPTKTSKLNCINFTKKHFKINYFCCIFPQPFSIGISDERRSYCCHQSI